MVYKSGQIVYRFVTIHACDRRTDGRTDGQTDGQNSHHKRCGKNPIMLSRVIVNKMLSYRRETMQQGAL